MRWALVLAALALALAGCESTQTKSARLEAAAKTSKHEKGLIVGEQDRDVTVEGTTMLQDANGAATVVELRNRSARSLVGLPLAVQVRDKAKERLYANDAPGLDPSLVGVAALAGREKLAWVNDQVTLSSPGQEVLAQVGAGAKPGPAELPKMDITGLTVSADASGDVAVTGDVANRSEVEQRRLVVYVVARKDGQVVAAARAIVEKLAGGAKAHFSTFPIGDPRGAELSAAAPPTAVTP
jgi:hypothetical protein